MHSIFRPSALGAAIAFLPIACAAGRVLAQVPEGCYVLARAADPSNGTGGLSILNPRAAGSAVAITGLPAVLVGWTSYPGSGASAVAIEPGPTGRLLVGSVPGFAGNPVYAYLLPLAGTAVSGGLTYYLGTAATAYGGVTQIADFGAFAVAAVSSMQNGAPLWGARLAYLDKTTGAVAPIPLTGLPLTGFSASATINAIGRAGPPLTYDAVYLGVADSGSSGIFMVPVPSGGTPVQYVPYSYPGIVTNIAVEPTGEIHSVYNNVGTTNHWVYNAVNPYSGSGGSVVPGGGLNGIATESTTYGYAVLQIGGPTGYRVQAYHPVGTYPSPSSYTFTTLATASAGTAASGMFTGIAWQPTPVLYGTGTPGANTYGFDLGEFELGMPFVGSNFTLRATSTPGLAPGWLAVSFAPASFSAFGIGVLVDPGALIELRPVYPGTSWFDMSTYMVPAAAGLSFCCQTIWFEPGGLAASPGLRFRVQ